MNDESTNQKKRQVKPERKPGRTKRENGAPLTAPKKLKLLFTVVPRKKGELFADLLQAYEINLQFLNAGNGTAKTETLRLLGLDETDKAVIVSVIRDDLAPAILDMLEEKFRTIRDGKGIAWTVPLTSAIGVAIYQFLSNHRELPREDAQKNGERGTDG